MDTMDVTPNGEVLLGEWWIDAATGEVLRHVDLGFSAITCMEDVERVLDKLGNVDASMLALSMKRKSICDHIDALIKAEERKRNWIILRYEEPLRQFAAYKLDGRKERTLTTVYGRLSFRKVPSSVKLREGCEQMALRWAKRFAPAAVKRVESLLISNVPKEKFTLPSARMIFERTPDKETFKIDTGIGKV